MVGLSDIRFWGITLDNEYLHSVDCGFHISMAALEPQQNKDDESPVSVMIEHKSKNFVLCTLQHGRIYQQALDLNFSVGEEVTFYLIGKGTIHLTGYLHVDDDMDNSMGTDDMESPSESSDVEFPLEGETSRKRKKKDNDAPGSKKRKVEIVDMSECNKSDETEEVNGDDVDDEANRDEDDEAMSDNQCESSSLKIEKLEEAVRHLEKEVHSLEKEVHSLEKEVQSLKEESQEHTLRTGNLILRESILEINHELAKKVLGTKAKAGYATVDEIEKHIQSINDPILRGNYLTKLTSVKAAVGWTTAFEESKKKIKSNFQLNSYAHPPINSDSLQWAQSKFETACPERTKLIQEIFKT